MMEFTNISELKGKILTNIKVNDTEDEILFICDDGSKYRMFHCQECCETVVIDDINGNLQDLIGTPILIANESTNSDELNYTEFDSLTWTFYTLGTVKGYVHIRWYGESTGNYSEAVDFCKLPN